MQIFCVHKLAQNETQLFQEFNQSNSVSGKPVLKENSSELCGEAE